MRGVAVDCANPSAMPTARRLKNTELDSIRIEMRDLPGFYKYTASLAQSNKPSIQQAWLTGPSTGRLGPILSSSLLVAKPDLVIIGNEPDTVGPSSWTMTPDEYIMYYNETAYLIRSEWPGVELATAGMYNPDYLASVISRLAPQPTYLNRHYPDSIEDIRRFGQFLPGKTIVGEWCWRGAKAQEMYDWENMLEYHAWHSFYFCWSDNMVPGMGLVTKGDNPTKSWYNYRAARRKIHGR